MLLARSSWIRIGGEHFSPPSAQHLGPAASVPDKPSRAHPAALSGLTSSPAPARRPWLPGLRGPRVEPRCPQRALFCARPASPAAGMAGATTRPLPSYSSTARTFRGAVFSNVFQGRTQLWAHKEMVLEKYSQ